MVGNALMAPARDHSESIAEALEHMHPELARVRGASGDPVYLVGGAVRDLLLGRGRADVDLVVEGDAVALARALSPDVISHERFGTVKLTLEGHEVDVAGARSERYPHPGALPVVEVGADLEADLGRRDFTVNAMAIPLRGEPHLVDPFGGQVDLAAKQLRVLHEASFADDPTRAIRAARYASRFGFGLEPRTAELLRATDLGSVSAERRQAELLRLAGERKAADGFSLLSDWGLLELRAGGTELAAAVSALLDEESWQRVGERDRAILAAALGPPGAEEELALAKPQRPSEAVEASRFAADVELVLARAMGAEWLDRCLAEWRDVTLDIDGEDLIAAGLSPGPALGHGLEVALRRKLDGEIAGRDEELAAALEAARGCGDGVA